MSFRDLGTVDITSRAHSAHRGLRAPPWGGDREFNLDADPDVVLMDLRMPRVDGVEATKQVRAEHPRTHVVVLTTYADDESVFGALQAGARGYLTKDASAEQIADAIATVHRGEALLAPAVQRRLVESLAEGQPSTSSTPPRDLPAGLTRGRRRCSG